MRAPLAAVDRRRPVELEDPGVRRATGCAARRSASITWPRHDRESVVAAKNTSAGEYCRMPSAVGRNHLGPDRAAPMNGEFSSSAGCSVSQVSANSDGSPRPISVRVSSVGVAEDHRDVRRLRRRVGIERVARQRPAVLDRAQVGRRAAHLDQLLHRQRAQVVDAAGVEAERRQQRARVAWWRSSVRLAVICWPLMRDDAMEQAARRRHRHQRGALRAAARLAEDRDVAGVAAELGDVVAHPLRARGPGRAADVARVRQLRPAELGEIEVAERVQAMVDGDDHDVAAAAQARAVGLDLVAGAAREGAAVEPDHHRPLRVVAQPGRPDVQVEAVFADRPAAGRRLRRDRTELERVAHAGPRRRRDRRQEAPGARCRRRSGCP